MLVFFAGGLVGVDKHLFQRVSLITSMTLSALVAIGKVMINLFNENGHL